MAKFTPLVTEEDSWRSKTTRAPRRTSAEIEVSNLRAELETKQREIDNLVWQHDSDVRISAALQDQVRNLSFELRQERNNRSSGGTTIDLSLWRRLMKLVHPDYHAANANEASEVTKLVIAMKPRV